MGCGSGKHLNCMPHPPATQPAGHHQLVGNIVTVSGGDLDTESLLDSDMDVSCSETLQIYIQDHPEFTREFKAVFQNVQKLQQKHSRFRGTIKVLFCSIWYILAID